MPRYLITLLTLASMMALPGAEVTRELKLSELGLPAAATDERSDIELINIDGGEAVLDRGAKEVQLLIRLRAPGAVRGVVVAVPVPPQPARAAGGAPVAVPPADHPRIYPFSIAAAAFAAAPDGSERMHAVEDGHFRGLLGEGMRRSMLPTALDRGARAWWSLRLGEPALAPQAGAAPRRRHDDLDQTIDLFSGLTALDENLQFDRGLAISGGSEATVESASLPELQTREVPWARMPGAREGAQAQIDDLAKLIPGDQHAVFFPSFTAMTAAIQHADQTLSGPLQLLAGHGEDALTRERYQRQLGVELSELSSRFGALVIDRIALTGSDPFLRLGSDAAVLLHATQPALLAAYLGARQQLQVAAGGRPCDGAIGELKYHGVATPDRALSSFVAIDGEYAVISNSLVQLNAYAEVKAGKRPALAAAPELSYFRRRYVQDGAELALAVISDATIRRWCSARWRIGDSRRTRAHAWLCALQAQWINAGCPAQWVPTASNGELGSLTIDANGVRSSRYGSLAFMTPISELDLGMVTAVEAAAYRRFIERYQRSWRDYLDPIAIRLQEPAAGRLAIDLSILPLIVSSEYRDLFRLTGATTLPPGAADPHPAPFQLAIALDHQGGLLADAERDLGPALGGLAAPLGWVGDAASLYVDDDAFWEELARAGRQSWLEENLARLPLAITIQVRNPLKLAAFLSGIKVLAGQSSPGLVSWSTRSWKDIAYAVVSPGAEARQGLFNAELLYLAAPESLTLTLSTAVMHHAIERLAARRAAAAAGAPLPPTPWIGEQLAAGFELPFLAQLSELDRNGGTGGLEHWMRQRTYDDIAILNEWHRLFPGEDPLAVHQRLWGTRLLCPFGGTYRWNEAWLSMESTALGAPDQEHPPKSGLPAAFASIAALRLGVGFTRLPDPPAAAQQPAAEVEATAGPRAGPTSLGLHTRIEIDAAPASR